MQMVIGIEQVLQDKAGMKSLPKHLQEKAKKYKKQSEFEIEVVLIF